VDHLRGRIPGFQSGGVVQPYVPDIAGLALPFRIAMQGLAAELVTDLQQVIGSVHQAVGLQPMGGGGIGGVLGGVLAGAKAAAGGGSGGAQAVASGHAALESLVASVRKADYSEFGVTVVHGISQSVKTASGQSLAQVKAAISAEWKTLDSLYADEKGASGSRLSQIKQQINAAWKVLDPLYSKENALQKGGGGTSGGGSVSASQIATQIVSQVKQELAYAQQVSQNTIQGLNLGGMQVPTPGSQINMRQPGPGQPGFNPQSYNAYVQAFAGNALPGDVNAPAPQQTVQQQMQSYLKSIQAFTKDLATLHKEGLNKGLMQQLVSAGPVQGDALAQSIMGGQGGVKAANQLWNSINGAARGLGIMAANLQYGGHPSTTTLGGQFAGAGGTIVNVNIGGGISGDLQLSSKQLNQLTSQVQAALLKQAKKNRRTGVQLAGYGA